MSSPALHNLFKLINNQLLAKTPNTISSSFNVATCLSMLADGASGKSREELVKFFDFAPPSSDFKLSLRSNELEAFNDILHGKCGGMVKTAQALFVNRSAILPSYVKNCQKHYRAFVKNIDPANPNQTVKDVNKFVAEKTEGNITNILSPGSVGTFTVAVLVAALFFKGKWAQPFPAKNTEPQDFFVNDKFTKKVDMMTEKLDDVVVVSKNRVITVAIPYEGRELIFVAEIHESKKSLPQSDFEMVKMCAMTNIGKEVRIFLPKFKASCDLDLVDLLKQAGVKTLFDPKGAKKDFAEISPIPLCITSILHKAVVEIDEEGTKAAAVTVHRQFAKCAGPGSFVRQELVVNLNRPFHFHIVHKRTGVALFSGSVCDPTAAAGDE
jgi:serpin B